ncbi:hypothetical protein [Actinophytocola sp.]|uniref:hypothetical protein n=1 Tax=Actinophytocola sp. TaxID=1872138 RepID=UPI003C7458AE
MPRSIATIIVVFSAVLTLSVVPTPARAAVGDLVCAPPTSSAITFTPPLTTSPQTATVRSTNVFGPCVSTTVPAVTSGYTSVNVTVPNRSCLTLAGSGTSTSTITWNTGQTSELTLNFLTEIVGGVYTSTVTGAVTGGLFAGDSVVSNQTGAATDIALCLAGLGTVSSIYTVGTMTFV